MVVLLYDTGGAFSFGAGYTFPRIAFLKEKDP